MAKLTCHHYLYMPIASQVTERFKAKAFRKLNKNESFCKPQLVSGDNMYDHT